MPTPSPLEFVRHPDFTDPIDTTGSTVHATDHKDHTGFKDIPGYSPTAHVDLTGPKAPNGYEDFTDPEDSTDYIDPTDPTSLILLSPRRSAWPD